MAVQTPLNLAHSASCDITICHRLALLSRRGRQPFPPFPARRDRFSLLFLDDTPTGGRGCRRTRTVAASVLWPRGARLERDRKGARLNDSHTCASRTPSST